jgi:hypothetical protein
MHHDDCGAWEYSTHPEYQSVVGYCQQFLLQLRADPASKQFLLEDTRPAHGEMFCRVVPRACPHLAGNYRGSDFECLRNYNVKFGGPPAHLGTPALYVMAVVGGFHTDLLAGISELEAAAADPESPLTPAQHLLRVVQVMAFALQRFFTIHPYANGNGHMGRMLVWIGLGRFGMLPTKWWLNASPPGYGELIDKHRRGDTKPLERYLICAIKGKL